jgi:hypothetical protein
VEVRFAEEYYRAKTKKKLRIIENKLELPVLDGFTDKHADISH